jgi:hypothetical protein
MKRIMIILYVTILALSTLYAAVADDSQKASAASMTWYLTDSTTTPTPPTGANYNMYRGSGNGSSDLTKNAGSTHVWASDETANISLDMSGAWSVTLVATSAQGGAKISIDIGEISGGVFTSRGNLNNQAVSVGTNNYSVTTTGHTISSGDYIAIQLASNNRSFTLDLTGTTNSPTFISSPTGAPDYPGTVIISFTITDYGADGVNFGSLALGTVDDPEDAQTGSNGAVRLDVDASTNVDVNIDLKGENFSGPATYLLSSADVQYDDDQTLDEGTETGKSQGTLTTSFVNWYSVSASTNSQVQTYHWITVPSDQYAGSYTSTFTYQCVQQ